MSCVKSGFIFFDTGQVILECSHINSLKLIEPNINFIFLMSRNGKIPVYPNILFAYSKNDEIYMYDEDYIWKKISKNQLFSH